MSTNARRPTCDIKTNHLTPNEAADTSSEVEILSDMHVTKSVVERKQDIPDKGCGMLKEGGIYSVKKFVVKPNKDEYRILKNDAYMLEFYGSKTIRKASVKAYGFVRYPFQLRDFDDIELSDNKYLIDVAGYVTNVGRTNHLKSGSRNLDFHIANHRGQSIRVTLWGSLRDVLIEKKPNRLVCAQLFYLQLVPRSTIVYLSSTSSTVIYDDDAIPAIKALKKENSVVDQQTFGTSVDLSQPQTGTLENLLMWARNRKNDVTIDGIRTRKGWNFPSCGSDTCKKALTRQNSQFFCQSCNTTVDYPVLRYRLEVDILPSEGIKDSVGSSNLDDYLDNQPQKLKRIIRDPSIVTPSKPVEERKKPKMDVEDSESEDSGDSANDTGKKGSVEPSAKKRKNRVEFTDSDANSRYGSGRVGTKGTDATHEKGKGYTHIPFCLDD
ncbi:replication protein A 70 kDa DNA-binding subunit C-like protein [Tanacetum coccineum]